MRVLVCGSRSWIDVALILTYLQRVGATLVIHGGAKGADRLAGQAAAQLNIPVEVYPPDWDSYGKQAGFIRNGEMLSAGRPDLVLAFWDGQSRGTRHMIELALSRKFPTLVIVREIPPAPCQSSAIKDYKGYE